jgi:hypothetical protein
MRLGSVNDSDLSRVLYTLRTLCTLYRRWVDCSDARTYEPQNVLRVLKSRDSAVGIAAGYRLDGRYGHEFSQRRPDWLWGFTQPPIQLVRGELFHRG